MKFPRASHLCFFAVLLLALALVAVPAGWRVAWADRASTLPGAPVIPGRHRIVPFAALDGLYWISYAQEMAATGSWRVHATQIDNAPLGREVHWSSSIAWCLLGLGHIRQAFTGEPLPTAIEYAAGWANPLLLMLTLTGLGLLVLRRHGPAAALGLVVVLVGSPQMFNSFAANEPDHHGLINAASLGCVLCLLFGGLGWERTTADGPPGLFPTAGGARRWFLASAGFGATGLWLSAATQIPLFAGIGLGALLLLGWTGRDDPTVRAHPELWRLWGRWGAIFSLGFYAVEYFPSHLSLRLEVNHPLYAVAWWGSGELLAAFATWRQQGRSPWPDRTRDRLVFLFAVGALLAPLAAIAVGGQRWFSLLDPVAKTLPSLVIEGTSLVENIRRVGAAGTLRDLAAFGLLLLAGLSAVAAPSLSRRERALVLWPVLVLLPLGAMAVAQNRWFMVVAPLASTLAVTTVVVWRTRLPRRVGIGLLAAGSILLIALFPVPSALSARHLAADPVLAFTPDDVFVPALRHYAQQLRRKLGPGAAPIVFAGPNESVLLAYYGGFPVLGTLYWENLDGMKAATAIATAPDLALARQLLAARRVGCLFSYPKGNFAREFATLASGHPDEDRLQRSFLMLLYGAERFPVWLRPIHLSPPTVLPPTPPVACYAFAPDQTEEEQVRAIADFLREDGRAREADALLRRLPAPESPRP